jgi:glycosyltransferase involved in cell wall biosynthesis
MCNRFLKTSEANRMCPKPSLALLIPAYNACAFLPRLLESAARQTEPFDEIWVYDDCSTDNTAEVAKKLGANLVRGDVNRGCTYGKSVLVERTSCDWVHFHDADDLLMPNFVERAHDWTTKQGADVVCFACEERWEDSGELIGVSIPNDRGLLEDPIGYTIRHKINAISGIYRRSSFLSAGGFDLDPEVLFNEDQACHTKLARAGLVFRGDKTVTVINLRRRTSMWTSNQSKALRAHYNVMRKALAGNQGERNKDAIAKNLWDVVGGSASQLDWETADDSALLAISLTGLSTLPPGRVFRNLCRISPRGALRVREWLIRLFKPALRQGYPGWRTGAINRQQPSSNAQAYRTEPLV